MKPTPQQIARLRREGVPEIFIAMLESPATRAILRDMLEHWQRRLSRN